MHYIRIPPKTERLWTVFWRSMRLNCYPEKLYILMLIDLFLDNQPNWYLKKPRCWDCLMDWCWVQMESSFNASKNSFYGLKMLFSWGMHELTCWIYCIYNIRPGNGEILQCTNKRSVSCWGMKERSISSQMIRDNHWCCNWIWIMEIGSDKNVSRIVHLAEEHSLLRMSNF